MEKSLLSSQSDNNISLIICDKRLNYILPTKYYIFLHLLVMNTMENMSKLKELLTSWNVACLYDLFKEEGINIDELQMMKIHHIDHLLKDYKMGIRIRFEHNLLAWRKQLDRPLVSNDIMPEYCTQNSTYSMDQMQNGSNTNTNAMDNSAYMITNGNEDAAMNTSNSTDDVDLRKVCHYLPEVTHSMETGQQEPHAVSKPEPTEVVTIADDETEALNNTRRLRNRTNCKKNAVTLKHILRLAGARGAALTKCYQKNKGFMPSQRALLIQTIVDFFTMNGYHLSLNMSHNLEAQILKQFPNEKLEYYRTEKRGKIYVKFCNMKRYNHLKNNTKANLAPMNYRPPEETMEKNTRQFADDTSINLDDNISEQNNWNSVYPKVLIKAESNKND